jgi:hypothetical protein
MIYKCNKCGFADISLGIKAHLVKNKSGCGDGYELNKSDLINFSKQMTEKEYYKELKKRSEDAIKNRNKTPKGDKVNKDGYLDKEEDDSYDYKPEQVEKDIDNSKK